nr:uncharacterized protein LOC122272309 [Parasteatoda tepidariorum]
MLLIMEYCCWEVRKQSCKTPLFVTKKDGIQMKSLSSLHLQSSNIEHNERYGLHLDAEGEYSTESCTELLISDSHITQNGSYGMFLNYFPMTDISLQRPSGDFTILNFFRG